MAQEKSLKNETRINNTQRKALVELAKEIMEQKIQRARDENGELVAEITEKVKLELGVNAIDDKIDELENQLSELRKAKEKLGFEGYNNRVIPGSKARMLIDSRTCEAAQQIQELQKARTNVIAELWMSQTLEEARGLIASIQ